MTAQRWLASSSRVLWSISKYWYRGRLKATKLALNTAQDGSRCVYPLTHRTRWAYRLAVRGFFC